MIRYIRFQDIFRVSSLTSHCSKRHMRAEPEDELMQLEITETLSERLAKTRPARVQSKNIGRVAIQFDNLRRGSQRRTRDVDNTAKYPSVSTISEVEPLIPLEELEEVYAQEKQLKHLLPILEHYNIFRDIFQDNVCFSSCQDLRLKIAYDTNDCDNVVYVSNGNILRPEDCSESPLVGFEPTQELSENLYSLLLVNLDGHLKIKDREYLHWFCANMSANEGVDSGNSCPYLPPIPMRGTGYHRYVFILLEHNEEFSIDLLPKIEAKNLESREFSFAQFYRQANEQTKAVPVGLKFFQSEWDDSVRTIFHETLGMDEPAYEYDYPPPNVNPQEKYPRMQPFDRYLDRYRDPKDVKEQILKEFLSATSPFLPPDSQEPPYPLATPTKKGLYKDQLPPTWIQERTKDKVLRRKAYKHIFSDD